MGQMVQVRTCCAAVPRGRYYSRPRLGYALLDAQNVGVCPDAGLGNSTADNNVKLLSCSYTNGITRVEFERPLKAHDKFDWAWPTGRLSRPVGLRNSLFDCAMP